jgi:crotonobetainyl-CoA:carnitine CoA-transferase CaiB-like acyl-CoA transferase
MAHVLDLSHLLPGALIASEMVRAGHRVTRIESPERSRHASILGPKLDRALRASKKTVRLDLKSIAGQTQLAARVRKADALIHGFTPATAKRLGLDAMALHRLNPSLILVQLHGSRPLHDLNAQALSGVLPKSGEMPALPFAQWAVVFRGSLDLLAALHRARRPRKTVIHVSLETALKAWTAWNAPLLQGIFPCYSVYPGKVHWTVAAVEPHHWKTFCEHLDLDVSLEDRFATGARGQRVRRTIQRALGLFTLNELILKFRKKPCCVVASWPLKP